MNASLPGWAEGLFAKPPQPRVLAECGRVRVWSAGDETPAALMTGQFTTEAETYNRRYAASDHFQHLFAQALAASGVEVAPTPVILDLGSGSGVNSVVPCRRLFPGARAVASDLSIELLDMLAGYLASENAADEALCVQMDAMGPTVRPGLFDLVTGAAILHHLDHPHLGIEAASRALRPGGHAIFFEPFNGWALIRLAFERILAEASPWRRRLDPELKRAMAATVADIACRTRIDRTPEEIHALDDKWLFAKPIVERMARNAGFSQVRFVPHNDHPTMYRDVAAVQLRLNLGRDDLVLPGWALAILDSFDAAMSLQAKRELCLDATIVLTK